MGGWGAGGEGKEGSETIQDRAAGKQGPVRRVHLYMPPPPPARAILGPLMVYRPSLPRSGGVHTMRWPRNALARHGGGV
eukprot:6594857-Pyramimonas_sp.AAC.1